MEVTRVEPSGASLRVVNLSWDVAPLSAGFAPYGGAMIQRRTVLLNASGGLGEAGTLALGGVPSPIEGTYLPLTQVSGHVLDFDDYTVVTGTTYMYRVIPVSQRGVPNNVGAREGMITVTGPTTPGYFPGTVLNLRLKGKTPLDHEFEGRNIDLQWDPPTGLLFSETFYIQDYIVEVWAPGQLYLLRRTTVPAKTAGETLEWTYTLEQNTEDQLAAGQTGARRDLLILVWARTNTNRVSLTPGQLAVLNPPPDMGDMIPVVTVGFGDSWLSFDQFVEPRDFDHYEVRMDSVTPPLAIYNNIAIAFSGQGNSQRKIALQGLAAGITYYIFVLPWDTFGPGIPSHIVSFVAVALDADSLDTIPPALPTGLTLTTGSVVSDDGTIQPWVRASWNLNSESDMAVYELHFFIGTSPVPTTITVSHPTTHVQLDNVAGGVTIRVILMAKDKFDNKSPFTAEASILTGGDTVPPGVPTSPEARGSFKAAVLLWVPPGDSDYFSTEVFASNTNNLATAVYVGEGFSTFVHRDLATGATAYWWLRAKDTSKNVSAFVPGPLAGLAATTTTTTSADIGNLSITETKIANDSISTPKLQANSVDANKVTTGELITLGAQIRNAIITDAHITTLTATKITTGTLQALVSIGVGNNLILEGPQRRLYVTDVNGTTRVLLGKLGDLTNTQYGLQLFNEFAQLMWNFTTGATTNGISDASITATKIQAATIVATHLRTDTAVITTSAQIANAIIGNAHITNLTVSKLLTGNLGVFVTLGVGGTNNIQLDGTNRIITVFDELSNARIWLGRLGVGATDYGLMIFNAAGQTMWDFNSGSSVFGIQNLAVTSAKIGTAQITSAHIQNAAIANAHIGNLEVDSAKIANLTVGTGKIATDAVTVSLVYSSSTLITTTVTEALAGILIFPVLAPGDQVLFWASGSGGVPGGGGDSLRVRIREDNGAGTELSLAVLGAGMSAPVFVQAIYTNTGGTTLINKEFVFTFQNFTGSATVQLQYVRFVGLVRKK